MTMGRPTDYDPAYCDWVVQLGAMGKSRAEIAYELGVVRETLTNWSKAHPEFLGAMTRAKLAEQVWWERKGRDNLESREFQASMWSRSMSARFPDDWRENTKNETTLNAGDGFAELFAKIGAVPVFPKAEREPDV